MPMGPGAWTQHLLQCCVVAPGRYRVRFALYLWTSLMFSYSLEAANADEVPFHSAIALGL